MSPFWHNKKVLLTGHTGFKGAWLTLLLNSWGAKIYGYALPPETPSLFRSLRLSDYLAAEVLADISSASKLSYYYRSVSPDITIHMAAQSLVLPSYADPLETFRVNVLGTATVLDVIKNAGLPQTAIIVTSDKVYENLETKRLYSETDRLGGIDPYSTSKACAELIANSYQKGFFKEPSTILLATARAGNVVGAGDWSSHRLVPDVMRTIYKNEPLIVRHPSAVRPWQHVLEPLSGYLRLAEVMANRIGTRENCHFNFGPEPENCRSVEDIIKRIARLTKQDLVIKGGEHNTHHEAGLLYLNSSHAKKILSWTPRWDLDKTLNMTVAGYKAVIELSAQDARDVLTQQISDYFSSPTKTA